MSEPVNVPRVRPRDKLRTALLRDRRFALRAAAVGLGVAALMATIALPTAPRLLWNASASAPIGLYLVTPGAPVRMGDMVVATLPDPVRLLAARRRYLPLGIPLVKRIAAGPGTRICGVGNAVLIGRKVAAFRLTADSQGRPLPAWSGCRTLRAGDYFLLMTDRPDSFDGRYFGPSDARHIVGKAHLLWAR